MSDVRAVLVAGLVALVAPVTMGVPLGGCHALGYGFAPGASCRDTVHFAAPPRVVRRGSDTVLTYTQGSYPFFFLPEYQAVDGRLVFVLRAFTSSGSLAGRTMNLKLEGAENLRALERGGAFWWEPDGTLVRLQVEAR